jgi:aspartyl-tRNA(Asn)/glutamyl-tRNA(Gln) amidotransferase subunit A
MDMGVTIARTEMTTFHRDWFAQQPADYSQPTRERFETVKGLSAVDYILAQRAREAIRAELWAALDQADVLVTPTMPRTATRIGGEAVITGGEPGGTVADFTKFTYPFNLSGFPALSVPCGFDRLGLPIGLQLAAGPWQEGLLLRVGHAFQLATDWHGRRPVLDQGET